MWYGICLFSRQNLSRNSAVVVDSTPPLFMVEPDACISSANMALSSAVRVTETDSTTVKTGKNASIVVGIIDKFRHAIRTNFQNVSSCNLLGVSARVSTTSSSKLTPYYIGDMVETGIWWRPPFVRNPCHNKDRSWNQSRKFRPYFKNNDRFFLVFDCFKFYTTVK